MYLVRRPGNSSSEWPELICKSVKYDVALTGGSRPRPRLAKRLMHLALISYVLKVGLRSWNLDGRIELFKVENGALGEQIDPWECQSRTQHALFTLSELFRPDFDAVPIEL